jgi:hypothetical protein
MIYFFNYLVIFTWLVWVAATSWRAEKRIVAMIGKHDPERRLVYGMGYQLYGYVAKSPLVSREFLADWQSIYVSHWKAQFIRLLCLPAYGVVFSLIMPQVT